MNTSNQLRSAVGNIQDELQRILAVVGVHKVEHDLAQDDFKNKLINEFNVKLRGFKSKVRDLTQENTRLRERIAELEGSRARPTKSEGGVPSLKYMPPPKRQKTGEENERVQIISSPIKAGSSQDSQSPRKDLTSSQFNRLPTQYSDSSDQPSLRRKFSFGTSREQVSPVKTGFIEEDLRIVADSQDEFEPLDDKENSVPPHYTALQRIEFLRTYLRSKFTDRKFAVDLKSNPITEKAWTFDDFKPNASWKRPKVLHSHAGAMTKAQERNYHEFFKEAGYGTTTNGPRWNHDEALAALEGSLVASQIMDKYLSPPGFMVGSFPDTQEQQQRKAEVQRKAAERMSRRLNSAVERGEFVFYEEVLNQYVAEGRYTR